MLHYPFRNVNNLKHICSTYNCLRVTFANAQEIADKLYNYLPKNRNSLNKLLLKPKLSIYKSTPNNANSNNIDSVKEDQKVLTRQLLAYNSTSVNMSK